MAVEGTKSAGGGIAGSHPSSRAKRPCRSKMTRLVGVIRVSVHHTHQAMNCPIPRRLALPGGLPH